MHFDDEGEWVTKDVPEGKEIIGVYGGTGKDDADNDLFRLGFIVWTPNPASK